MGLIMVLLLIVAVGGISAAIFYTANYNIKVTGRLARGKKAFYAADAGINYAKYLLASYQYSPGDIFDTDYELGDGNSYFNIDLNYTVTDKRRITVISDGYQGGEHKSIKAVLLYTGYSFISELNKGLAADGDISLGGNSFIIPYSDSQGDILSNSNIEATGPGNLNVGEGIKVGALGEIIGLDHVPRVANFIGLEFMDFVWDEISNNNDNDSLYPEVTKDGIILGSDSDDKIYYIDAEDIDNNITGKIKYINGTGILFINAGKDKALDIKGNMGVGEEGENLLIIINGSMDITANSTHYATYITMGDIKITGTPTIYGNLISKGKIDIIGNTNIYLNHSHIAGNEQLIEKLYNESRNFKLESWEQLTTSSG